MGVVEDDIQKGYCMTNEQIKEIAEDLEMGFRCFVHKKKGDIRCYPDEDQFGLDNQEAWEEDRQAIKKARGQYLEIEKMTSQDQFKIMEEFIHQVDQKRLQEKLLQIISSPKPFRNFKAEIDAAGAYREKWFAFKSAKMQEWVARQLQQ